MNIDLSKYLKNKDVKISNDDFDLEALGKDVSTEARRGYVKPEEATKDMVKKSEYDTLSTKYSEMESNYNNTVKTLSDTNDKLSTVSLEKTMISKGFKEESFGEVSKLRKSLFADEKDDAKAIDAIAERFKGTYFAESNPAKPKVPNEPGLKGGNGNNNPGNSNPIKIDRNTPISSLFKAKQ